MRKEEDMVSLIKSLSKTEKRYFKLFVTKNSIGASSNYLKTINAVKEQTEALKQLKNEIEEAMKDPLEAQLIETVDIIST